MSVQDNNATLSGNESVGVSVKGFMSNTSTREIAALSGEVLLQDGAITAPVQFFDFTLPLGYTAYRIDIFGVDVSNVTCAVSQDGGATFINDPENFDSYVHAETGWQYTQGGTAGTINAAINGGFDDALIDIGIGGSASLKLSAGTLDARIYLVPGSSGQPFRFSTFSVIQGLDQQASPGKLLAQHNCNASLNRAATIPVAPGVVNAIRFSPYGNGDINPPTSGDTFTATGYSLWGIV